MLRLLSARWMLVAVCLWALCSTALSQEPPGGFTRYPDCSSGPLSSFPICDSSLPVEHRAASLLTLLNVSEKVTRVGESYGNNGIERIGLPVIHFRQNAIHGLGPGVLWTEAGQDWSNCTMFPHVIGIGASFNRQLFNAIGAATSDEARAFANVGRAGLDWFTPNINIYRDPRWGRGQETPGEDPYLSSEFAVHFVRGLQEGEDTRFIKTIADCKHYAGYDLEVRFQTDRQQHQQQQLSRSAVCSHSSRTVSLPFRLQHWGVDPQHPEDRSFYSANITDQELVESYLPPFEACVTSARVGSIMCSYNVSATQHSETKQIATAALLQLPLR
jgi:beta-D-xylosidase 4